MASNIVANDAHGLRFQPPQPQTMAPGTWLGGPTPGLSGGGPTSASPNPLANLRYELTQQAQHAQQAQGTAPPQPQSQPPMQPQSEAPAMPHLAGGALPQGIAVGEPVPGGGKVPRSLPQPQPQPLPQPERPAAPVFDASKFSDRLAQLSGPSKVQGPDFSGYRQQQEALQARLEALMRGEGINIGDVSGDPEARAYRVAKEREAARARQSEADRLGASGMTGSGDFDARVAGIRESTGEAIASQQAGLAGRRRLEAQQGAIQAAGLTLSDLDRKFGQERTKFESELERERSERSRLAEALGQEIAIEKSRYGSESDAVDRTYRQDSDAYDRNFRERESAANRSESAADRAYREQVDTFERGFREKETAADRAFREQQASRSVESEALERAFRESQAKLSASQAQIASKQTDRQLEQAAKQQQETLRAELMRMELGETARKDDIARLTPKDDLQNILLQQEILKNRKLDPKIGYPALPVVTGATAKKPATITTRATATSVPSWMATVGSRR